MKKALPLLVGGALVLAMGLSGCGTGNGGHVGADSGAWAVNYQTRDKVKDGGEFHGSFGSLIKTWNLATSTGNDMEMKMMQSPLGENWYLEDGAGNHTMNPNYLKSMKDEMVGGKLVLNFTISDKAVWNDGAPITAADWIATVNALNGTNKDFDVASSDGWNQIETIVKGATDKDVTITFKAAYPDWVALFVGGPLRAESCTDPEVFNNGWTSYNKAWYSGPYIVTDFVESSNTVTMERNPIWWGDKGKLDKIIFKYVAQEQVATAFANGELDYMDIGANADAYMQAKNTPNTEIRQAGGPNFRHFTFNSKSEVLQDLAVRQAIVMGLDRAAIASSDLAGLPIDDPTKIVKNSNLFMPGQAGYVDYAEKTGIKYDPEGAKKKLEADGYAMGPDGYYAKNGKTLELGFSVLTGVAASEGEGRLAQEQLKKIGVKLNLVPVNVSTDWPGVLVDEKFDIIAFSWMGTAFPLMNIGQIYGWPSDSNFAQLSIDKVQELEPKVSTENDPAKRLDLAKQVDEAIWTNVHTLPLYQRPALAAVKAGLANFGSFGMAQVPYTWVNVGWAA